MPKKRRPISDKTYLKRAKLLRGAGFNISYGKSKKNQTHKKSAVTRAWYKARYYLKNTEENRIEFRRIRSKAKLKKWGAFLSRDQLTPGGFFIQRPSGIARGRWKASLDKEGNLQISTSDKRKVKDLIIRLDVTKLIDTPKRYLQEKLSDKKRAKQLMLTVNGFDAAQSFETLDDFERYCEDEFIPRLQYAEFNFDKWGNKIFGLKLIYDRRKTKIYDFKKEGIFEDTTETNDRKKYKRRKVYSTKKGRKKGS